MFYARRIFHLAERSFKIVLRGRAQMEKIKYECFQNLPKHICIQKFADIIGVSKSTAYRIVDSGKIKSIRLSERRRVIFKEDLLEWIEVSATGGDF